MIKRIYNRDFDYSIDDQEGITSIEESQTVAGRFLLYKDEKIWREVQATNFTICFDLKEYNSLPNYGDLMTLSKFRKSCKNGLFINYDGSGYYSDGKRFSYDDPVDCDDFVAGTENTLFTHVIWFNK